MKIAIVGSRDIYIDDFSKYLKEGDEVVSGGASGVDCCVKRYAEENGLTLTEFLPQYQQFGRAAPIVRNQQIVNYADRVVVFWNGSSKGALSVINYAKKTGKLYEIVLCDNKENDMRKR